MKNLDIINEMLAISTELRQFGPSSLDRHGGMCRLICRDGNTKKKRLLRSIFLRWPLCADRDGVYPVPASRTDSSYDSATWIFLAQSDIWDETTEYGQLRMELLDFVIATLEAEIRDDVSAIDSV